MSKSKAQGTTHESDVVTRCTAAGLTAKRLAEGGSRDEGDVEVQVAGTTWHLECKARQALSVQECLSKAQSKAGGRPAAVVWKRLVRVDGQQRRRPVAGQRMVVVLAWDDFLNLITPTEGT